MADSKSCSPEDGRVLILANLRRVTIGNRSAIINVHNWADSVKGIQHQVSLDFDSTTQLPEASPEAQAVIARLFPGFLNDPNSC